MEHREDCLNSTSCVCKLNTKMIPIGESLCNHQWLVSRWLKRGEIEISSGIEGAGLRAIQLMCSFCLEKKELGV